MKAKFSFSSVLRFAAVAAVLSSSSMLSADVVNFDFGNGINTDANPESGVQVGAIGGAAPDAAGTAAIWNDSTNVFTGAVDSFGMTTTVGVNIDKNPTDIQSNQEISTAGGITALQGDYLSSRAGDSGADLRTGAINGLVAGNAYDLYFFGQGDNFGGGRNGGQNVGIRIGTDVRHTSWDGDCWRRRLGCRRYRVRRVYRDYRRHQW